MLRRAVVLAALGCASVAHADRIVAIAPLATMGAEDTSAGSKAIVQQIETAVAALPQTKVVPAAQVADAIKKAKRSQLKACEGDVACLVELGKLVGATVVISGEVGGLGDAKVVYLGATDVMAGKELRSTTLSVGAKDGAKDDGSGGASGAVVRLLEPDRYRGTVHLAIDVGGATVFVNGTKVSPSAAGELALPVGAQAVRVTHPQYRDFVRFIDVAYGRTTEVAVPLQQYPIVEHDIQGKPTNRDKIIYVDPPVYRRWYVVGPAAIGLAVLTAVVVGYAVHDFPGGECRKVGGGGC